MFTLHTNTSRALSAASIAVLALAASAAQAQAQQAPSGAAAATATAAPGQSEASIQHWLERLHQASRNRAYIGTFVVSSGSEMASSKIWHICDGRQQLERIEALTGAPRITMRRNDEVATFLPEQQLVLKDRREALRVFPDLLRAPGQRIEAFYRARSLGSERVAGLEADVVDFVPKDGLRYGYRIWSERRTGLMVKMQTRNQQARVLEQVAFTELQLDAPVRIETLTRQFEQTSGMRVLQQVQRQSTAAEQGWRLRSEVPGFQPMALNLRGPATAAPTVQWVFSDGLASVSLFIENFDPLRHTREAALSEGATHTISRRLGAHWVTALGEVPPETLLLFMQSLERAR